MSGADERVHLEVADQVATITLDSPDNRNALSRALVRELTAHLTTADGRDDVRVVVLTHTGGTFCAGADLAEALETGMEETAHSLLGMLRALVSLSKPVVAAVRGHVRAGGAGLVGACDLAITTVDSTFAFSESLLGLTPAVISLTTRTRLGERDAAHKFLTGTTFSGQEAAASGLVTSSVSRDEFDAAIADLVAQLRRVSPQGLRETKRLLNRPLLERMDAEGERLVALSASLFASDEAREGMTAFHERRSPSWSVE
jgi:enoyl-CoA hydratase/carnithine racemase